MVKNNGVIFQLSTRNVGNSKNIINLSNHTLDTYEVQKYPLQEHAKNETIATDIFITGRLGVDIAKKVTQGGGLPSTKQAEAAKKDKKDKKDKSVDKKLNDAIGKLGDKLKKNVEKKSKRISDRLKKAIEEGGKFAKQLLKRPEETTVEAYEYPASTTGLRGSVSIASIAADKRKIPFAAFNQLYKGLKEVFSEAISTLGQERVDEILLRCVECESTADEVSIMDECVSAILKDARVHVPQNDDDVDDYITLLECLSDELLKYINRGMDWLEENDALSELLLIANAVADHIGEVFSINLQEIFTGVEKKCVWVMVGNVREDATNWAKERIDEAKKAGKKVVEKLVKEVSKEAKKAIDKKVKKLKKQASTVLNAMLAKSVATRMMTDEKPEDLATFALLQNGDPTCYQKVDYFISGASITGLNNPLFRIKEDLGVFFVQSYEETFSNEIKSPENGFGSYTMILRRHTFLDK